jgi:hypothetical protein
MEVDLPRRKIKLTMLFNRVPSLLEGMSFNRRTRNWSTNILMGELDVSTASIFIITAHFFVSFFPFAFLAMKIPFSLLCLLTIRL